MKEIFKNSKIELNDFEWDIMSKYEKILEKAGRGDYREYEQMCSFIEIIPQKITDHDKYFIFHLLVGSTVSEPDLIEERGDFPGNFSIKNFLDSSIEERDEIIRELKK